MKLILGLIAGFIGVAPNVLKSASSPKLDGQMKNVIGYVNRGEQRLNPKRNAIRRARSAQRDSGQHAKFKPARKRTQKTHIQQRDSEGAFTLVGREPRRKWVGGISAMRGQS